MRHVRDSKGSRDLMTCLAHSISFDGSVLYSVSCGCTSNPHSTMYRSFRYWVSKRKFPPTARKKKTTLQPRSRTSSIALDPSRDPPIERRSSRWTIGDRGIARICSAQNSQKGRAKKSDRKKKKNRIKDQRALCQKEDVYYKRKQKYRKKK